MKEKHLSPLTFGLRVSRAITTALAHLCSKPVVLLSAAQKAILGIMADDTQQEAPPSFIPATAKIVEAVIYLIEEAAKLQLQITQYDIVKTFWFADKEHLDEYGRPITFDNYRAMEHGPVGSAAYDILKPDYDWSQFGLASAPWARQSSPGSNAAVYRDATRPCNQRKMSGSDRAALRKALLFVKSHGFERVRKRTHGAQAYRAAWKDDGGKSFAMDARLIPDVRDDARISDLAYASRHQA